MLSRELGGHIIFRQAGWEPIDTWRKSPGRHEARKVFVVPRPRRLR
jgi:hypothetical protein